MSHTRAIASTSLAMEISEQAATRLLDAIMATFERLQHFLLSGSARTHLAPELRVAFHSPYAIYYVPGADVGAIVRVLG